MSILQSANVNVTSTLTIGNTVANQSVIAVGTNVINSTSINSTVTNTNILAVDRIQPKGANATIIVPSGYSIYSPGSVVQVINTFYTTPTSVSLPGSYTTYTDIPGITATITPKSSNSKIYMTVRWFGEFSSHGLTNDTMFSVKRNGTVIGQPPQPGAVTIGIAIGSLSYYADNADSTPESGFFDFYDSPGTVNTLTYNLCAMAASSVTLYVNRCVNGATSGSYERGTSSITLFEIAG
jgi:hypothetical protein